MWNILQFDFILFKFNLFGELQYCKMEGFISAEIFIYFFINSDSNLTQTQMFSLNLFLNRTLTQTLT